MHASASATLSRAVDREEVERAGVALEAATSEEIIAWAWQRWGQGMVLASSFQDCVLLDLVTRVAPDVPVVFLDTQYHFPETLDYVEQVRRRYDLNLEIVHPQVQPDDLWRTDPDACCSVRKVQPLARALEGRAAWLTGLRRVESATRARTPVVAWDARRGLAKVAPLARWTDADVQAYGQERDLPRHPLTEQGFASIGCWPCTRPVNPGEDPRAGRWAGTGKTECGLHL